MCISASTIAAYAAAAGVAASVYSATQKPKVPQVATPKLPQSSKAPEVAAMRANNAGPAAGVPSTLLTGSDGIDTASLSLGRATLLGQ